MHKFAVGIAAAALIFGVQAGAMDCEAMFKDTKTKLSADKDESAEYKVKQYRMAVSAYDKCKEGEEDEATDLLRQIFDTSGRM